MHSKDLLTRFIQWIHFIGSSNGFPHWIRAKDSFGRLPRQGGFAGTIAWSDTGQKLPGLSGRLQPCAIVEREPSVHPRPLPEGGGLRTPRAPSKVPSTTRCLTTTVLLTGLVHPGKKSKLETHIEKCCRAFSFEDSTRVQEESNTITVSAHPSSGEWPTTC